MGYRRLSAEDRVEIEGWWQAGHSPGGDRGCWVGRAARCVVSCVGTGCIGGISARWSMAGRRACRRERGPYGWGYSARVAQRRAEQRAVRRRPAKLIPESALRALVLAMLRGRLSPKQIAGRLRREHPGRAQWQVSHETIYRALYLQGRGNLRAGSLTRWRCGPGRPSPHPGRARRCGALHPAVDDRAAHLHPAG